jgi:hypothetical protein
MAHNANTIRDVFTAEPPHPTAPRHPHPVTTSRDAIHRPNYNAAIGAELGPASGNDANSVDGDLAGTLKQS